ncbi:MAG: asparaginase [Rubrobacter sp.]|nr:asparaginase [Rubrobacter sp.]MBA3951661.1 asparaginase [Rubrobacter sp.]MDQ3361153.1 asparaginase [Actinomycetota bacterium]MDQ3376066.1 asparaginase [Actinomycetota bacterium]
MGLPRVTVFSMGGTISSVDSGGKGVEPTLTGEALVSDVPEIAGIADVSAVSFRQAASGEIGVEDLVELAAEIEGRIDGGAAGAVVTQGTDTIEETSFVLDLLVDRESPVVVTGAMRNPTLPGADGPANLLAAIQVAASDVAKGLGTVVVLNDEIHAARFVRKTHTSNPATFRSDPVGPVGWISESVPRIVLRPTGKHKVTRPEDAQNGPVALYHVALGDDGRLLPEIEEKGYAGLVVEAMGGGHVPSVMAETLEDLASKMPVLLASRTGGGEVLRSTYGFIGSETDLLERGLIYAGPLDGRKARLLLTLLLRSGATKEEVKETFDTWLES